MTMHICVLTDPMLERQEKMRTNVEEWQYSLSLSIILFLEKEHSSGMEQSAGVLAHFGCHIGQKAQPVLVHSTKMTNKTLITFD